jgi:myosin-crossreactive antigen
LKGGFLPPFAILLRKQISHLLNLLGAEVSNESLHGLELKRPNVSGVVGGRLAPQIPVELPFVAAAFALTASLDAPSALGMASVSLFFLRPVSQLANYAMV